MVDEGSSSTEHNLNFPQRDRSALSSSSSDSSSTYYTARTHLSDPEIFDLGLVEAESADGSTFFDAPTNYPAQPIDFGSLDRVDLNRPDSQETKAKQKAIMSQLNNPRDVFDSVAWDPILTSLSPPDKSPEPVTIKPQPVAYTTVGSVVNPKAAPQFSAPNRIQREGAQRKSLVSILQTYDAVQLNQLRSPPPPLNMANSMQYAQQLGRNTAQSATALQATTNQPSRPTLPTTLPDLSGMSDEDLGLLLYSLGHKLQLSENNPPGTSFTVKDMSEDDIQARSAGPIQGLEKMQTVQRLSKFPNPMQELAKNKLSEFSVARSQTAQRIIAVPDIGGLGIPGKGNTNAGESSDTADNEKKFTHPGMPPPGKRLGDMSKAKILGDIEAAGGLSKYLAPYTSGRPGQFDSGFRAQGELDPRFQFPPPGLARPSGAQANPLYRAYASGPQSAAIPTRPPGYPQPLTAGPPGQRQHPAPASVASAAAGNGDFWGSEYAANAYNPLLNDPSYNAAPYSPWATNFTRGGQTQPNQPEVFPKPGITRRPKTVIRDTLSPQDALKYYPRGLPSDMTGQWTLPSEEWLRKSGELPPLTREEKEAKKLDEIDNNFYSGYRRLVNMKHEDYEAEFHARQANPHGPIAPPPKCEFPKMTLEEIMNKSEGELSERFVEAALGNLYSYLDKNPGSRFHLSQWKEAEEDLLDRSKEGDKSFFGEDWGVPPKSSTVTTAAQPASNNARADLGSPNPDSASQMLAAKHAERR